jgi:hypothetical protein
MPQLRVALAHPGEGKDHRASTPKGLYKEPSDFLCNPFGVGNLFSLGVSSQGALRDPGLRNPTPSG